MANIFDYLKWRADVPFKADPFNEVDNLILSELIYTPFDGILRNSFRGVSLRNACELYFDDHSREQAQNESYHILRAPLLMDGMLSGRRFADTRLIKYVNTVEVEKDMQMAAVTYLLKDGSAYIAFRGTDNTVVGWKEDFNMSYLPVTEGQRSAVRYLNEVGSKLKRPLRVGGHSKGGNFAVFAAAFCDKKVQDRIIGVYTNDGPGFRSEVMKTEEFRRITPKVTSIVPDSSIIGMLLSSGAEHKIVKSNEKGLAQHNSMTWQVERNRVVTTEQSPFGQFIQDLQTDWLSKIDDDSREAFVNTLFSLLESTGMDTFGEMKAKKIKTAERLVSSLRVMPKEKQKQLMDTLEELLQSGTQIAKNALSDLKQPQQD